MSLAYILLHSLWQLPLLYIIAKILIAASKANYAQQRQAMQNIVALQLFVSLATWPLLPAAPDGYNKNYSSFLGQDVQLIIMNIYCGAVLFKIVQLAIQYTNFIKELNACKNLEAGEIDTLFKQIVNRILPGRELVLKLSNSNITPYVFGFFNPVVVLPASLISGTPVYQVEMLLLHEIMHIKMKDHVWQKLILVADIILWFNPIMHFIKKEHTLLRELACDEAVLEFGYKPSDYAEALKMSASVARIPQITIGAAGTKSLLIERMKRWNAGSKANSNLSAFVLPILICCSLWLLHIPGKEKVFQKQTTTVNSPQPAVFNATQELLVNVEGSRSSIKVLKQDSPGKANSKSRLVNSNTLKQKKAEVAFTEITPTTESIYPFIPANNTEIAIKNWIYVNEENSLGNKVLSVYEPTLIDGKRNLKLVYQFLIPALIDADTVAGIDTSRTYQ